VTAFQAYEACRTVWTDMQDHLPYLFEMSHGKVLEIGVRGGASTSALLAGVESKGGHLWSVDINNCRLLEHPDWTFIQADSNAEKQKVLAEIPDALDLLFVDGTIPTQDACRTWRLTGRGRKLSSFTTASALTRFLEFGAPARSMRRKTNCHFLSVKAVMDWG
jgi:hypothetical protein